MHARKDPPALTRITALMFISAAFFLVMTFGAALQDLQLVSAASGSQSRNDTALNVPAENADSSLNWSGYVAMGGKYTSVSGSWIVPDASADSLGEAHATWVGIGGVLTRDLIQAGTEAIHDGDRIVYLAWIETLPGAAQTVPLRIRPGDSISTSLSQLRPGEWLITIMNNTTGKSYRDTVYYDSSLSSAEWVQEMPTGITTHITLDSFGRVDFANGTTVRDGTVLTIAEAGAQPLKMVNRNEETLAHPSILGADGASFSVVRTLADSEPLTPKMVRRTRPVPQELPAPVISIPLPLGVTLIFGN